ncbi:cell division protein FtsK, partial [Streptococcus suis]
MTYLVLAGALIFLFAPARIRSRKGTVSGFCFLLIGLLIEFQAYLDLGYKGSDLFNQTFKLIMSDLSKFKVTNFAGGGLLGSIFYWPVSILFANAGAFFIGFMVLAFGIFQLGPWSVYDVADGLSLAKDKLAEGQAKRAELREVKRADREEKRQQELARLEEE